MKIAFFVSSIKKTNPGIGGHFYSLLETVSQLSKKHEVLIINIGIKRAKALEDINYSKYFVTRKKISIKTINTILKEVNQVLEIEKPDILHAFDMVSFYWVRKIGNKRNIPFCITKCGGVNPVYFPYSEHFVLFSEENKRYFIEKKKYSNSYINLIPNRISDFNSDFERIKKIKDVIGNYNNSFKFFRIARIGKYYDNSSRQLINLVNRLTDEGVSCCLIFIGSVEDEESFKGLKSISGKNCFYFTSIEFTKNAKELIEVADAVLGTGRSFMEAASKGKVLFSPIEKSEIPLFITQSNLMEAFAYNFSERIKISEFNLDENYDKIKNVINKKDSLNISKKLSLEIYKDYFDSSKLNEKYSNVYNNMSQKNKENFFDLFLNYLFVIKKYYRP